MFKNARPNPELVRSTMKEKRFKPLDLMGWRVYGGPFREAPLVGTYNVNLQAEKAHGHAPIHHRLPIVDYSLPAVGAAKATLARIIFMALVRRKFVYIGCMGGIGRTGLILSLLVRIAYDLPGVVSVDHVRSNFHSHAVETDEQQSFVNLFPCKGLRRWLKFCKLIAKYA